MRKLRVGWGALVGALLTAPLLGLMYLADHLLGLTFAPYDLFDGVTRVMPGALITFGIDLMIDTMRFFSISVADTAKTAEVRPTYAAPVARRQFLIRLGGATAAITVLSGGVGNALAAAAGRRLTQELDGSMAHLTVGSPRASFPNANDPVMPVPGTLR